MEKNLSSEIYCITCLPNHRAPRDRSRGGAPLPDLVTFSTRELPRRRHSIAPVHEARLCYASAPADEAEPALTSGEGEGRPHRSSGAAFAMAMRRNRGRRGRESASHKGGEPSRELTLASAVSGRVEVEQRIRRGGGTPSLPPPPWGSSTPPPLGSRRWEGDAPR
jgi:hypothetical protein